MAKMCSADFIHWLICTSFASAETLVTTVCQYLAEKSLLRVIPEMLTVVKVGLDMKKLLELVHDMDGVVAKLLAINDEHLSKMYLSFINDSNTMAHIKTGDQRYDKLSEALDSLESP